MKVIWIVGGSTGIGYELAIQLVVSGHTVIVSARDISSLVQLVENKKEFAQQLIAIQMDAADEKACMQVWSKILTQFSKVDWIFLNAAVYEPSSLIPFDQSKWRDIVHTNVDVVLNPLAAILSDPDNAPAQLFITASLAGYRGLPKSGGYGMSKAALISLAESIQPELDAIGCRIRIITPGFVATRITAKNRFKMPALISSEDAAKRILKKANAKSFEITFPWRFTIWIKLLRILPYCLYFKITKKMIS